MGATKLSNCSFVNLATCGAAGLVFWREALVRVSSAPAGATPEPRSVAQMKERQAAF